MLVMCPYCKVDSGGNHQSGCPNNPMKIIHQDPYQTTYLYKGTNIYGENLTEGRDVAMKKFGEEGYITTSVDEKSLTINIPLNILKTAFEYSPDNYDESTIFQGEEKAFAELVAEHLHDEIDSEDGSTYIHKMFDSIFNDIFDGNIIGTEEIIYFGDEDYNEDDYDDE